MKSQGKLARLTLLGAVAAVMAIAPASQASAAAPKLTFAPTGPTGSTCFMFHVGTTWAPFGAFIYQNLPPFELQPGDVIAFDPASAANDTTQQLTIDAVSTTTNGSDVPAGPFTTLVTNSSTPAGAPGNGVLGDFDLRFTVSGTYAFPGGGLILRFSSPAGAFATDNTCVGGINTGSVGDPSGFFVRRAFGDADGTAPWTGASSGVLIGGFQVDRIRSCQGQTATIIGTSGADTLEGTAAADVISSGEGDDTVTGLGGNDTVCLGGGKDKGSGGGGADKLDGEAGKDTLKGGPGKDRLRGGAGKDVLRGGKGRDVLKGGAGKDNERQ